MVLIIGRGPQVNPLIDSESAVCCLPLKPAPPSTGIASSTASHIGAISRNYSPISRPSQARPRRGIELSSTACSAFRDHFIAMPDLGVFAWGALPGGR